MYKFITGATTPKNTPVHSSHPIPPYPQGLKYEKNPATKATITQRVDGYMKRAEDLKVGCVDGIRGEKGHVVMTVCSILCH